MKTRWLCALLACVLLFSPLTGASSEIITYTLGEKLSKQIESGSGLRMTFELSAQQTVPWFADAASWGLTASALDALSGTVAYQNRSSIQELSLSLSAGNQILMNANMVKRDGILASNNALWGGQWLGLQVGDATVLDALSQARGQRPGTIGVLAAVLKGDETWNARGETAITPYVNKLSQWLIRYGRTSIARDSDGRTLAATTYTIPMQDLITQLKVLLIDLYSDTTALNLLSERLSAPQIASYLQPGMRDTLASALDAMDISGTATLTRANTLSEEFSYAKVSFPMPKGNTMGLDTLDFRVDADGSWSVQAQFATALEGGVTGARLHVDSQMISDDQNDNWTRSGQLIYEPETLPNDNWQVGSTGAAERFSADIIAVQYTLESARTETTNTAGSSSGTYSLKLLVRPIASFETTGDVSNIPAHTITLSINLASGSNRSSPTNIDGTLAYEELDTGAHLTLAAKGRTTAPWTSAEINTSSVVRLDNMSAAQLETYLNALKLVITQNLGRIIGQ